MNAISFSSEPVTNLASADKEPITAAADSVVLLSTAAISAEIKGAKAVALDVLASGGLPVPAWFLVLPEAMFSGAKRGLRDEFLQARDPAKVKFFAQRAILSPRAHDQVSAAVDQLLRGDADSYFAVRVSYPPGLVTRHAPSIDSLLYLRPNDVPGALISTWQAIYSEETLFQRGGTIQSLLVQPPPLIVQRMVRADVSGLAYGGDPGTGRRGVSVVAAVYGLGTSIAHGESDADTVEVTRERVVVRRETACKQVAHVLDAAEGSGVGTRLVAPAQQMLPLLTDSQAISLADLAWRAGALYGRPQEIEWSMEAGSVALLGSRPAPALNRLADPDAPAIEWQRTPRTIGYPDRLTALSFSVARSALQAEFEELCRSQGLSDGSLRDKSSVIRSLVGQIDGALYLNANAVTDIVAGLPQPEWHLARILEGLVLTKPESSSQASTTSDSAEAVHLDVIGNTRMFSALQAQSNRQEALHRDFSTRLQSVLDSARGPIPLERLRVDELVQRIQAIRRDVLDHWDAPAANQAIASICYGLLGQLTRAWCDDTDGALRRDLIRSVGDLPGTAAAEQFSRLTSHVSEAGLVGEFRYAAQDAISAILKLDSHTALRMELDEYLDAWGDVSPDGLKIEAHSLRDRPMPLLRAIGIAAGEDLPTRIPHALLPGAQLTAEDANAAKLARARVERLLSDRTVRRLYFDKVLTLTKHHTRQQELYRFDRVRTYAALRKLLNEIGCRLFAVNALQVPQQILHLELEEIIGYVAGTGSCTDLNAMAEVRSRQYARWVEQSGPAAPPERVLTRMPVPLGIEQGNSR